MTLTSIFKFARSMNFNQKITLFNYFYKLCTVKILNMSIDNEITKDIATIFNELHQKQQNIELINDIIIKWGSCDSIHRFFDRIRKQTRSEICRLNTMPQLDMTIHDLDFIVDLGDFLKIIDPPFPDLIEDELQKIWNKGVNLHPKLDKKFRL